MSLQCAVLASRSDGTTIPTSQPAYGSPAGGRDVGIVVSSLREARTSPCTYMLWFFDASLAKVVNGSKSGVVHVLVPRISLSDGEVKLVTVTLRCAGTVVGQGAFVYYDPPRRSERDRDWFP